MTIPAKISSFPLPTGGSEGQGGKKPSYSHAIISFWRLFAALAADSRGYEGWVCIRRESRRSADHFYENTYAAFDMARSSPIPATSLALSASLSLVEKIRKSAADVGRPSIPTPLLAEKSGESVIKMRPPRQAVL